LCLIVCYVALNVSCFQKLIEMRIK